MARSTLGMSHSWRWAAIGTLLAIACTTTMDAVGLSGWNYLPLVPLFFLYWYLWRLSRAEIGLTWGCWRDYGLALFYPALVLGLAGLIAWLSGAVNFGAIDWAKTLLSLVFSILVTILLAIVTEEGLFRGWLWASLQRAGVTERGLLVWTSVAFAAWHISTALLPTDFHPPLAQVPIYLLNAAVIGLNWGLMRQRSGSIVVTSVSHGLWNGLVYTLFGGGLVAGVQPRPCHQGGRKWRGPWDHLAEAGIRIRGEMVSFPPHPPRTNKRAQAVSCWIRQGTIWTRSGKSV